MKRHEHNEILRFLEYGMTLRHILDTVGFNYEEDGNTCLLDKPVVMTSNYGDYHSTEECSVVAEVLEMNSDEFIESAYSNSKVAIPRGLGEPDEEEEEKEKEDDDVTEDDTIGAITLRYVQ